MHRRLALGLAIGAAMLLMSCSGAPIGSDDSVQNVVSTDSSQSTTTLPDTTAAKCDRIGSRVIKEFVAAFNDGGIDLDPFFATGKKFQWYSDDQRLILFGIRPWNPLYEPYHRTTLIAYLGEARQTRGPMTLNRLTFTGFRVLDQATGYAIRLEWDGSPRLGEVSIHCGLGQINMWSLGPDNP